MISRAVRASLTVTLVAIPVILAVVAGALAVFGGSAWITAGLLAVWGLAATPAPIAWGTWLMRTLPEDAEAGGGLQVAAIQFAIMLGASIGGVVIDTRGAVADVAGSAVILAVAAVLAFLGSRALPRGR